MAELFGVDIAAEVAEAFEGQLPALSLVKISQGGFSAQDPLAEPTKTRVRHGGIGYFEARMVRDRETLIERERLSVLIIGGSLPSGIAPESGDEIEIGGETFSVDRVLFDSSEAAYTCIVHRVCPGG